ncbi:MAG TPA: tetratricopeptide repeat protein, partial [Vicinamibacteria bacterium]|nr:tetratricopeptide repeat protein [Vicinamibacteria bacterium]
MRDPSPRAPFDQGLFLVHFNKGKALYDERRYEAAERELEEAYLLRPRDQKVLNLLGLVYFKQEKYDKAEEVYRKLVAESPEAHTLFYNLGLIHFKLNRLEEAETTFLKALELSKDNPKINFYLGSIYERQHRFQDAIFQYRQAGANLMVRRVEDKMAAGAAPRG